MLAKIPCLISPRMASLGVMLNRSAMSFTLIALLPACRRTSWTRAASLPTLSAPAGTRRLYRPSSLRWHAATSTGTLTLYLAVALGWIGLPAATLRGLWAGGTLSLAHGALPLRLTAGPRPLRSRVGIALRERRGAVLARGRLRRCSRIGCSVLLSGRCFLFLSPVFLPARWHLGIQMCLS